MSPAGPRLEPSEYGDYEYNKRVALCTFFTPPNSAPIYSTFAQLNDGGTAASADWLLLSSSASSYRLTPSRSSTILIQKRIAS